MRCPTPLLAVLDMVVLVTLCFLVFRFFFRCGLIRFPSFIRSPLESECSDAPIYGRGPPPEVPPPSPHTIPPLCSGFPIIFVSWRVSSCSIRVMFCFLLRGQSQCPRCRFPPFYIMLSVIVKNAQMICAHVLSLSVDGERH